MITEQMKSIAISKIKCQVPFENIAEEMDIPLPLIKEWADKLNGHDLVQLHANIHAVNKLAQGEIIPPSTQQEEILRLKIEEVAIDIVNEVHLVTSTGDLVRAKTLQLCADTISKLYSSIVTKLRTPGEGGLLRPNGQQISAFKDLMKD